MKNIKSCSILLLALNSYLAFAQDFCATNSNIPDFLRTIPKNQLRAGVSVENNSYVMSVFFHIIRRSNGTGGQTQSDVNTAFNILQFDYQPYGISFELLGTDVINNDDYYNVNIDFYCNGNGDRDCDGDGKFDNFHPNPHANAIDIYLFANDKYNKGLAANIPGTALVIGGNLYNTNLATSHVLSHEMGHCLGLYHTFHGLCEGGCPELVNGNNCDTCGDYVCDTPPDPQMHHVNQTTCKWDGSTCTGSTRDANGDAYNPNTTLYMAYIAPNCMKQHTPNQVTRMKTVIANSPLLQNALAPPTITGPSLVCSQVIYAINNLPSGATVSWGGDNILTLISGQGTPFATFSKTGNGISLIKATISVTGASITLQKSVEVGVPARPWIMNGSTIDKGSSVTYTMCIGNGTQSLYLSFVDPNSSPSISSWVVTKTLNPNNFDLVLSDNHLFVDPLQTGVGQFTVKSYNSCGNSEEMIVYLTINTCSGGTLPKDPPGFPTLVLAPNPASTQVSVEITNNSDITSSALALQPNAESTYSVIIVNSHGTAAYSGTKKGKKFNVPVSSLPNGIYHVTVSDGTTTLQQKLVVKH